MTDNPSNPNNCSINLFCCHLDYHMMQSQQLSSMKRVSSTSTLRTAKNYIKKQRRSLKNVRNGQLSAESSFYSTYSRQESQKKIKLSAELSQYNQIVNNRSVDTESQYQNTMIRIHELNQEKKSNQLQKIRKIKRNQSKNIQKSKKSEIKQPQHKPYNFNSYAQFTLNQLNYPQKQNKKNQLQTQHTKSYGNSYNNSHSNSYSNTNTKSNYYYPNQQQRKIYNQINNPNSIKQYNINEASHRSKAFQQLQNKIIQCNNKYADPHAAVSYRTPVVKKNSHPKKQLNSPDQIKKQGMTRKNGFENSHYNNQYISFENPELKFKKKH